MAVRIVLTIAGAATLVLAALGVLVCVAFARAGNDMVD
jgi:hypothetical protein